MRTEKHYTQQELNAMSNEDLQLDSASLAPQQPKVTGMPLILWAIFFALVIAIACVISYLVVVVGIAITLLSAKYVFKS